MQRGYIDDNKRMLEANNVIVTLTAALVSICSFLLIRWMSRIEDQVKALEMQTYEIRDKINYLTYSNNVTQHR